MASSEPDTLLSKLFARFSFFGKNKTEEVEEVINPKPPMIVKSFASADDFVLWIKNAPILWRGQLSSETGRRDFTGTSSLKEAMDLARYGWPEGLEMLSREVRMADHALVDIQRPTKKHDIAGVRPNPGRAAAGDAFAMVVRGNQKKSKPVLKIATRMTFSGTVPKEKIMKWGASICSYVNMLEREGFNVELQSKYENTTRFDDGPDISIDIMLKRPEQPLSMSTLVFWWAHPSSLRRIKFAAFERMNIQRWYGGAYSGSYGIPATVTTVPDDTLYLTIDDARDSAEENLEVIKAKHLEILKAQNIELPRFFNVEPDAAPRQGGLSRR